ncbi:MAG: hypothetical protein WAL56_02345, partial [Candidatus Sulfotelmatobacter sp.]
DVPSRATPFSMPVEKPRGAPGSLNRCIRILCATMPRPGLCRENQNEPAQGPRDMQLLARRLINMRHSSEAWD